MLLLGLLAEPTAPPRPRESGAKGSTAASPPPAPAPPPLAAPREAPDNPAVHAPQPVANPAAAEVALDEIWQRILAALPLPSTRMLLSQQAHLRHLDERRAVVRVASNWITMVQSRLPLLTKAMEASLGGSRQITLEASDRDERSLPLASDPIPVAPPPPPPLTPTPTRPAEPPTNGLAPPAVQRVSEPSPEPEPSLAVAGPVPAPSREAPDRLAPSSPLEKPAAEALAKGPAVVKGSEPQGIGPETPLKRETGSAERRLEESASLFADFFNGQVIAADPRDDDP